MVYDNITVPFRGWTVVDEIGHGSYGKVYEIHRDGFTERSAMKVISVPQDPDEIQAYLRNGYSPATIRKMYEGSRASVLEEYEKMARLKDCPNIVRCEDIEVVMDPDGISSKIYIRMELLTPMSEYDKLRSFSEKEVIKLGSDICNMLTRCEAEDIVHRDIKPENILVSAQGDYKLGDFGIARSMDHTTMATMIGTMNYMAPEVYLGRKYGHTADIYSLGMVLYWLMNNKRMPFFPQNDSDIKSNSLETAQKMRMKGTPIPRPVNGGSGIVEVVLKALKYDSAKRYQSALEFGNEIKRCLFHEQKGTEILIYKDDQRIWEQNYQECISLMRAASSIPEYEEAENAFMSMHGYKDADKYAEECRKEINRLKAQRLAAGKRKKYACILAVTAVLCAIAVLIVTKVIIPNNVNKREIEGNLIKSGDFTSSEGWGIYLETGDGDFNVAHNEMLLNIRNTGTVDWGVQLYYTGFKLIKGCAYRISFDASCDIERPIVWCVKTSDEDFYAFAEDTVTVGPKKQHFEAEFTMTEKKDKAPDLCFNCGYWEGADPTAAHTIHFDNVTLLLIDGNDSDKK